MHGSDLLDYTTRLTSMQNWFEELFLGMLLYPDDLSHLYPSLHQNADFFVASLLRFTSIGGRLDKYTDI